MCTFIKLSEYFAVFVVVLIKSIIKSIRSKNAIAINNKMKNVKE